MNFNVSEFFAVTDRMDTTKFPDFFHEDAHWYFANMDKISGKLAVTQMAHYFFSRLFSIKHEVSRVLHQGEEIMFEGFVSYHLKQNGEKITLPFACSITLKNDKIYTYRTYMDPSPIT